MMISPDTHIEICNRCGRSAFGQPEDDGPCRSLSQDVERCTRPGYERWEEQYRAQRRAQAFHAGMALLLDPDARQEWWWLSFADPDQPEGEQFLGVAIFQAPAHEGAALIRSHELGINPGGQVLAYIIGPDLVPPEQYRNRLLSRAEVESL